MLYSVLTGKNRIPEWINSKQEENNVKTKEELNTFKEEVETMNRKPVSFFGYFFAGSICLLQAVPAVRSRGK